MRKPGYGVKLRAGSRIIMQVHYNLLAGTSPDISAAQLRLAPGDRDMRAAAHDAAAGARSSCRVARRTPTARCATATRPCST